MTTPQTQSRQASARGLKRMSAIETRLVGDADTRDGEMKLKGHKVKEDETAHDDETTDAAGTHRNKKTPAWRFFVSGDYCLQGDGC